MNDTTSNTSDNNTIKMHHNAIPDNDSLYNGPLALLNGTQYIAILSFYNRTDYERSLVDMLNKSDVKCINLNSNLWVIYRDHKYMNNAMYMLSLFIPNPIDQEISQHINDTFAYSKNGLNSYDYINGSIIGYPIDKIKSYMLQKYKSAICMPMDMDCSIFESPENNDQIHDMAPFDAMFNSISEECNKLLHYLFDESTIFQTFVKNNIDRIGHLPSVRPNVIVPKIERPKIIDMLQPPKRNTQRKRKNKNRNQNRNRNPIAKFGIGRR